MSDKRYSTSSEIARSSSENTKGNWTVYLLMCSDNTLYTGVTTDLTRRLKQHNGQLAGGSRYTAARRPCKILWSSVCVSRADAQRREASIRKLTRLEKEQLIQMPLPDE